MLYCHYGFTSIVNIGWLEVPVPVKPVILWFARLWLSGNGRLRT
jgi:hypothetical protein